jgi:hypothetical protein
VAGNLIGMARCPFCGSRARLTLAKTGLPVLTCSACIVQAFARSDRSDMAFRGLLIADEPAPAPAPAPSPTAAPTPAAAPEPPPAPRRRMGWGMLADLD